MSIEIDIGEMEARYFEILKRVCLGECFTVTVEGREVAEIRPNAAGCGDEETLKVLEELCSPRFQGARYLGKSARKRHVLASSLISAGRFPASRNTTPPEGPAGCGVGTSSPARRPRTATGGSSTSPGSAPL